MLKNELQLNLSLSQFNNLSNGTSTTTLYEIGPVLEYFFKIIYFTICLTNLFGNSLIIFVIIRNKNMHRVTNFFIINLALADITTSIFSTPFQVRLLFSLF